MKYKLVPVEPIHRMVGAACDADARPIPQWNRMITIYHAMLAAAPSPEWVPVSERLPTLEGKYIVLTAGNDEWQTQWFRPADRWELETRLNLVTHWLDYQPPARPV